MKLFLKIGIYLSALILIGVISFNYIIINNTDEFLHDSIESVPAKKVGLVLGASKFGYYGGINPYFQYRIDAAFELYSHGKIEKIIVSGDIHSKAYDETTAMAESLIELGVPDSCIIRDYAGFRTLDSVVRAKKVFNCSELIIVTQKFHNQRAVFAARFYGIDAIGYNARDVQAQNNYTHLREIGAKFLMVLDLYCFNRQPRFL